MTRWTGCARLPYNRNMSSRSRLIVALSSTAIACYLTAGLVGRALGDSAYGQLALFDEVLQLVLTSYVDPVNVDRAMRGAMLGLTEPLDGDSAYLDASEFREYQHPSRPEDADVGLALTRRIGFLMVVAARRGSPAERAGLRTGDLIKTIDGRHTRLIGVPVGEGLLKGAPGSTVQLEVLRDSTEPQRFSLVREKPSAAAPTQTLLPDGVGLLRVSEFSDGADAAARAELETLRRSGAQRLVLDLRGAAFGSYDEAVRVAELFLKGGVVTRLTPRHGETRTFNADAQRGVWHLPMAVLIDAGTSGPGEVVAAALAEGDRAKLVGSHTLGRAAVRRAIPLAEGGLFLTVARYFTPGGKPIHGEGLDPSVAAVARRDSDQEGAPAGDPVLDKAIEVLKGNVEKKAASLDAARLGAMLPSGSIRQARTLHAIAA
jgi:carboxyl-terminal processing protease